MNEPSARTSTPPKQPWDPPRLESFGTIEEMTQGPGGGNLDLLVGSDGGFQPTLS